VDPYGEVGRIGVPGDFFTRVASQGIWVRKKQGTNWANAGKYAKSFQEKRIEMKQIVCLMLIGIAFLSLGSSSAFAQATASATIQGTVTDHSGAVVTGAQVVAKNKGTDVSRTTSTSDTGYYQFELLPVGTYTVTISKTGFASIAQTIEVLIGQTATINAELKTGSMSEIVEVTSEAPLLDQSKTSVSQTITPTEVEELPMVGRDVANLAYLAPGVKATDSYDPTKNRYAILSVNGAGGRNVNVTVNGVDNKDNTVGGPVMQLPLEAVQEFQISTQRFSAENGRSEGAAINMITKQGTNSYHGSVFGFFRDSNLNTAEKDPNGDGTTSKSHPDYTRQQFGGSVGGPVVKDKLFGFFAIEREREHQAQAEEFRSFTELTLAQGAGLAAQASATIPRPFFETRYNGRMDWVINNKNSAYLSYNSQVNDSLNDQSDGTGDLSNGNFTKNHVIVSNFTLNSLLSNTTINQFTLGYQYWNNLIDSSIRAPLVIFPNASFGTNTNVPQQSYQKKWQFKDDISKTVGHHTFKAGVDFINNPIEGGFFEDGGECRAVRAASHLGVGPLTNCARLTRSSAFDSVCTYSIGIETVLASKRVSLPRAIKEAPNCGITIVQSLIQLVRTPPFCWPLQHCVTGFLLIMTVKDITRRIY